MAFVIIPNGYKSQPPNQFLIQEPDVAFEDEKNNKREGEHLEGTIM